MFTHSQWSTQTQDKRLYETATDIGQIIHGRGAGATIDRNLGERLCKGSKLVLEGTVMPLL